MRDDTRGDEASFVGFQFSTSIDEILQHRFQRPSAARWARNLRFLTYAGNEDDIDVQTPEVLDSSKEQRLGQCTRCELRVPPSAGHICATHAKPRQPDIKAYERKTRACSNPCIHVENACCEECMQIPLFPNLFRATKFRIRRLKPKDTRPSRLGVCTQYVAVSYCWSSAQRSGESNAGSEKYQVLEEDMRTVRPIRAPMDVIDRAVSFAAQNGIRMIWIDQVTNLPRLNMLDFIAPNTLPRNASSRDNEIEKELGIQAMDFVYTNAHISIGLFRATLELRHLQALLLFYEWQIGSDMPRRGPHLLNNFRKLRMEALAEALSVVVMDRWNTRAWVLQEAVASAGNMIILFPRAKEMACEGWSLTCQDLSLTEIGINLNILHNCINRCLGFFNPKPGNSIPVKLPQWAETLERLSSFLPEPHPSHMVDYLIVGSKKRRTCNAAVAWSFLKHRDNDRVADKLAILANLCDYTLRLNTVELDKSQKPLSVCIFALAVANGDLSLLSPDSYHIPRGLHNAQYTNDGDFTWVPCHFRQLRYIRAKIADPGGPNFGQDNPVTFGVTSKGLSLPGFLWKIDHFVELPTIKDKYAVSWSRLWRSKVKLEEQSLEATEKPYNLYEMSRTHWLAITNILFEVILLLRKDDQISVADAIWHSVMNAHWRKGDCLESVSDFPEQLTIEKRKGMFRLDESPDGSFEHKWLVDRIMLQGGFWVGRLVRIAKEYEYSDGLLVGYEKYKASFDDRVGCAAQDQRLEVKVDSPVQQNAELNMEEPRAASASQADDVAITPGHLSPSTSADGSSVPKQRLPRTQANYQRTLSMMIDLVNHISIRNDDNAEEDDHPIDPLDPLSSHMIPAAAFADYGALLDNADNRNSQSSLQQQRAVFDIEGDALGQVLVLTPFQKRLERLPRPLTRSMSVSWVVQPVDPLSSPSEGMDEFGRREEEEILKTSGMVRGMWKCMVHTMNRYKLV